MIIDAHTQLNFVIGNPIKHSQSPTLHQQLYASRGINAVMLAIENPDLPLLITSIKALSVKLTAVTLPYKTEILQYADVLSDEVKSLGAANTLILKNNLIYAYNTDVAGILHALRDCELEHKKVLLIGAGGAARAAAYAMSAKTAQLFYINRNIEKAATLAAQFGGEVLERADLDHHNIDVIVNCTPSSMPLSNYGFNSNQTVFDMVYIPDETPFMKDARNAGATVISGQVMFNEQAKRQVELFEAVSG